MKQTGATETIRKFNAKFGNSFVRQVAEMLAVSPHFHGHFATCGDWRQGCPPWTYFFYTKTRKKILKKHFKILSSFQVEKKLCELFCSL
jgi:hypothetical protein